MRVAVGPSLRLNQPKHIKMRLKVFLKKNLLQFGVFVAPLSLLFAGLILHLMQPHSLRPRPPSTEKRHM